MSQPGPADRRMPPPKHHPATRDELFEYGRNYAIWQEEDKKRRPIKRVIPVDPDIQALIEKYYTRKKKESGKT